MFGCLKTASGVDGLVPLVVVVGVILLQPRKREIVLDWSRASDSWLILDGVEDLIDRKL